MFRRARGNYRGIPPRKSGGAPSPPAPPSPPTIITSVPVAHWWRADLGVALNAGKVSAWNDQVGTAHLLQAAPSQQPAYNAADPTLNGQATITGDGLDDYLLVAALDFSGPVFIITVVKLVSSQAGNPFYSRGGFGGDGAYLQTFGGAIYQSGPSLNANVDFGAIAPLTGIWAKFLDRRHNNTSDYIKLGARAKVTGTACPLSTNPTQYFAVVGDPNTGFLGAVYREIIVCKGEPTPAELAAMDDYFAAQFGPPPAPSINYADLFPGAYQVCQADRGLSYGAVMRADAGNTSGVSFALVGAPFGVPVPIWIRLTGPGVANIYYDGLGVTPAMVGVPVADSVQIPLLGAGLGMAITPGVGSHVAGNTWRATCSGLADQSGNGKDYIQLTPANQPIVTAGLNGKPGLGFNINTLMNSTVGSLLLPGAPYQVIILAQCTQSAPGDNGICGTGDVVGVIYQQGAAVWTQLGAGANAVPFTMARSRFAARYTGTTSDSLQVGAAISTGTSIGIQTSGMPRGIGAAFAPGRSLTGEIFAIIYSPIMSFAAFDAAINTPPGFGPGAFEV